MSQRSRDGDTGEPPSDLTARALEAYGVERIEDLPFNFAGRDGWTTADFRASQSVDLASVAGHLAVDDLYRDGFEDVEGPHRSRITCPHTEHA